MAFVDMLTLADVKVVLVLIGVVAIASVSIPYAWPSDSLDPREPPMMPSAIPIIGHALGLLRYHKKYFSILGKVSGSPAFTISIFGSKMYVVTTPDLTQAAFRSKVLDFAPIADLGLNTFGLNEESSKIVLRKPEGKGEKSFSQQVSDLIHEALALGPRLDAMNARMLNKALITFNAIPETMVVESFYRWLRHTITVATCLSIFGDHDPFSADPAVEEALWDFDQDMLSLLIGKYPSVIARKGHKARKTIQAAFVKYLEEGYGDGDEVSPFWKSRQDFDIRKGLTLSERAKVPLAFAWAAVSNAIPTLYWIIIYVFSDRKLLDDLRSEVSHITSVTGQGGNRSFAIDMTKFSSDLPLMSSVYQEVLRVANSQVSARVVQADTLLSAGDQSYLLKKGAVVQLPTAPLHSSTAVWGSDADKFDPRRFLYKADKEKRNSFLPFGGGRYLCPGRHFAVAEIYGVTAVLITGFDLWDKRGAPIPVLNEMSHTFSHATGRPVGAAEALGAKFVRRKGMEHARFELKTTA